MPPAMEKGHTSPHGDRHGPYGLEMWSSFEGPSSRAFRQRRPTDSLAAVQARQRAVQGRRRGKTGGGGGGQACGQSRRVGPALGEGSHPGRDGPLSAGGGAVIAIVLVICMVGAIVKSPLGIFFSGRDQGGQRGQTIPAVVREINLEYDAKIEALKTGTYNELSLSGARAPWP